MLNELENKPDRSGNYKLEQVDKEFTYIFQHAAGYAVGVNRRMQQTEIKIQLISERLYWKDRIRLHKGFEVNFKRMKCRAVDSKVDHLEVSSLQDLLNCKCDATAKQFNYIDECKQHKQDYLLHFVSGDKEEKERSKAFSWGKEKNIA